MICAVSTKTTGLKPGVHEVIELNIKPLRGEEITFRARPDRAEVYEENVQKINGLSREVVSHFPTKDEFKENVFRLFEDITPVGHYFKFDYEMLESSFGSEFTDRLFNCNKAIDTAVLVNRANVKAIENNEGTRFKSDALRKVASQLDIAFTSKCAVIDELYWKLTDGN